MRSLGFLGLLALAGCVAPGMDGPGSGADPGADGWIETISFDGRTEQVACAVTSAQRVCHTVEGARDLELEPGPIERIRATFTWTPTSPVDARLSAYLLATDEAGEWQWEESTDTFASGPPPLTVDWDATRLTIPYHHLSVHLSGAIRGNAADQRVVASPGVDWHVEAEITRG